MLNIPGLCPFSTRKLTIRTMAEEERVLDEETMYVSISATMASVIHFAYTGEPREEKQRFSQESSNKESLISVH